MNEGVPKTESIESSENGWRERRDMAEKDAVNIINEIGGFESMSLDEQIGSLEKVYLSLQEDNENRFVARIIDHKIAVLSEMQRHENRMTELGVTA